MSAEGRLAKGDLVQARLAGTEDDWVRGAVMLATDANPQAVMINVEGGVRTSSGGLVLSVLPLTVDYEKETATAVWGDEYEIEVHDEDPKEPC